MADLWPKDFGSGSLTPPVKILREQATLLTKKTRGAIVASVMTHKDDATLNHHFLLEVPSLDNYTYSLLEVYHQISFYPLKLNAHGRGWVECADQENFLHVLKEVFNSDETRIIVESLLGQAMHDEEYQSSPGQEIPY
jgi:hypothetical protein